MQRGSRLHQTSSVVQLRNTREILHIHADICIETVTDECLIRRKRFKYSRRLP